MLFGRVWYRVYGVLWDANGSDIALFNMVWHKLVQIIALCCNITCLVQ